MVDEDTINIPHVLGKTVSSMTFNWTGGAVIGFTDGSVMRIDQTDFHGGQLTLQVNDEVLVDRWNEHTLGGNT